MAQLSSIRTRVLNLVNNTSMIVSADVTALIQAEHDSILNDYGWAARKAFTTVTTVAPYATGTVSGAADSPTVTGSGTTWTSAMVGRWFRPGSATFFMKITAFVSATQLTLETGLPTALAAGSGYSIFQHIYSLPADFGRPLSFTADSRLSETSEALLDAVDPYRSATATRPDAYYIIGLDASNNFQVGLWPVPSSAQIVRVEYLKQNTLVNDTDVPLYRGDVLVWKAAESAVFFLHGKTGDLAWLALADRYHLRYQEELDLAKQDDISRFTHVKHIQDTYLYPNRGDSYWLDHDWLRLRALPWILLGLPLLTA